MEKRDDDLGLPRGTTLEAMNKGHPFGRIGEPEDVANVALFLASDESVWVNGQYIVVSGTGLITSVPK
jgi:NAD(P)-dependent dehydrogenase (short-subunit alcohol dehydrogenase family)